MNEVIKAVVDYLALLGVPSIFTIIIFLYRSIRKSYKSINILQSAQKAQMRSQMLRQYDEYMKQGYIEQIYLDDWMNQYDAYHELVGKNDVLDARKEELIHLPNHKPE